MSVATLSPAAFNASELATTAFAPSGETFTRSHDQVCKRANAKWSPAKVLRTAMADSDRFAVQLDYVDSKGKRTRRTVSPIRFAASDRFLGLCLCREEPRQFHLSRCSNFQLLDADDVIMPVEMVELD
ncbi:transcriptional regulator [Rhodopirellula bahusiensis]|uniref:WYL domain-containing protein n=1 Tax=Rhodopirellula bahusiensis TaxID=2014065 RepID=UPI0032670B60